MFGIGGPLYDWFKSYLLNRRQRVTIKNACSAWEPVKAGVPQGSVLGPLLFLIHINDIVDDIESNMKLFADDVSLFITIDKNEIESSAQINRDLERMKTWAQSWLVSFNPEKSKSLYITLKPNVYPSALYFDNHQLESEESHKHLGLTFNNNLTWKHHIDDIYLKANKKVSLLSKLKHLLDRQTLQIMYTSFVRPSLEYGNVIWDNCSEMESDRLENIQRRAARILTGGIIRTPSSLLYEESGLEPLAKRRERNIVLLIK